MRPVSLHTLALTGALCTLALGLHTRASQGGLTGALYGPLSRALGPQASQAQGLTGPRPSGLTAQAAVLSHGSQALSSAQGSQPVACTLGQALHTRAPQGPSFELSGGALHTPSSQARTVKAQARGPPNRRPCRRPSQAQIRLRPAHSGSGSRACTLQSMGRIDDPKDGPNHRALA